MKHKTSELDDVNLNHAAALAEGLDIDGIRAGEVIIGKTPNRSVFAPSTNPAQGQPIMERERIAIWPDGASCWRAMHPDHADGAWLENGVIDATAFDGESGETQLQAAMRAYVASKFGDEVELP
jgi:hypothetical protein